MPTKIIAIAILMFFAGSASAEEKFWYFTNVADGVFHYTRILRCDTASVNNSDTRFAAANAAGPFDAYPAAEGHWLNALKKARKSGYSVALSEGVCTQQ